MATLQQSRRSFSVSIFAESWVRHTEKKKRWQRAISPHGVPLHGCSNLLTWVMKWKARGSKTQVHCAHRAINKWRQQQHSFIFVHFQTSATREATTVSWPNLLLPVRLPMVYTTCSQLQQTLICENVWNIPFKGGASGYGVPTWAANPKHLNLTTWEWRLNCLSIESVATPLTQGEFITHVVLCPVWRI